MGGEDRPAGLNLGEDGHSWEAEKCWVVGWCGGTMARLPRWDAEATHFSRPVGQRHAVGTLSGGPCLCDLGM